MKSEQERISHLEGEVASQNMLLRVTLGLLLETLPIDQKESLRRGLKLNVFPLIIENHTKGSPDYAEYDNGFMSTLSDIYETVLGGSVDVEIEMLEAFKKHRQDQELMTSQE